MFWKTKDDSYNILYKFNVIGEQYFHQANILILGKPNQKKFM